MEPPVVPSGLRRADVGAGNRWLAIAGVHAGRHAARLCPGDRGEGTAVRGARLQVAQLALQVRLEPAAVLALERAQVVDPPLELLPLLDQGTHGLAVPLLRVALQAFRAGPRVAGDLLRLAPGLAKDLVSLPAGPAQGLISFAARVGDGLVGGLLCEGEDTGCRVHVVLAWQARPDRLGPVLRLGHYRLGGEHLRLRI